MKEWTIAELNGVIDDIHIAMGDWTKGMDFIVTTLPDGKHVIDFAVPMNDHQAHAYYAERFRQNVSWLSDRSHGPLKSTLQTVPNLNAILSSPS